MFYRSTLYSIYFIKYICLITPRNLIKVFYSVSELLMDITTFLTLVSYGSEA